MRYRTTKCPYCGFKVEDRATHAKELIGPPLAMCPSCHHPIKTGMKYWPDMAGGEKTWSIFRSILLFPYTILFYTLMFCIVPGLILAIFVDMGEFIDEHTDLIMWYAGIVAVGLIIMCLRRLVTQIGLRPKSDEIPEWE